MNSNETQMLRLRLTEAEETLRAIREGEVDALMVREAENDQVLPLGRHDLACHAFMEAMDLGAAAFDERNELIYVNEGLARLLGEPAQRIMERGLGSFLGPAAAASLDNLIESAAHHRKSIQLAFGDARARMHLVLTAAPLPLSFGTGRAVTFTDITARVQAELAEESVRIGRAVMTSALEPVLVCDPKGLVTQANPAMADLLGGSPVGRTIDDALSLQFDPASGLLRADDLVGVTSSGGSISYVDATREADGQRLDVVVGAAPLRNANGTVGGCIVSLIDVSKQKLLETRQALLMRELDHRMMNMLTMVSAISSRTIATAKSLDDYRDRFGQRIAALASTQSLLASRAWSSLSIADLIRTELKPHLSLGSSRLVLRNMDFDVTREAAVALGLVFHELVTNAVKYGALSGESGAVTVSGTDTAEGGMRVLWEESGGPAVKPPDKEGFGQTLIAKGLGNIAAEPTQVEFAHDGLRCLMTLAPTALRGSHP